MSTKFSQSGRGPLLGTSPDWMLLLLVLSHWRHYLRDTMLLNAHKPTEVKEVSVLIDSFNQEKAPLGNFKLCKGSLPAVVSPQSLCYAACYPLIHITGTGAGIADVGLQSTPSPVTRPVRSWYRLRWVLLNCFVFPHWPMLVSLHYWA